MMKRKIAAVLSAAVLCLMAVPAVAAEPETAETWDPSGEVTGVAIAGSQSYAAYLQQHAEKQKAKPEDEFELTAETLLGGSGTGTEQDGALLIREEGSVTVRFSAKPGLYQAVIEYDPVEGRSRDVELALMLDRKLPYSEASSVVLPRRFKDAVDVIREDSNGNDIRPSQREMTFEERGWLQCRLTDNSGYVQEPLLFALSEQNELTVYAMREDVRIRSIRFVAPQELPTYAEYAAQYAGVADASRSLPVIQAELPSWKTNSTLVAQSDRSSPATTPYKGSKISLNMIGGNNWTTAYGEMAWEFTPEETGMYEIRLRCRQNYSQGFYSVRTLKLNGEIPFEEARSLRFTYNRNWEIVTVSAGDTPCRFYFEAGKTYTLSMSVSLGEMGEILGQAAGSIATLNDIYSQLLMIMSASPDSFRDYHLEETIPETIEEMRRQADALEAIAAQVEAVSGATGGDLVILTKTALQLRTFYDDPDEVAKNLSYFKDNIATLNDWMVDAASRPLALDTITVAAPSEPVPEADAGFFEKLWYGVQLFVASFVEDYNSLGGDTDGEETITVWTTAGRDQSSIYSDMIRSFYTPYTEETYGKKVGVNLQLVSAAAILPSLATGNGPDVLFGAGSAQAIDYALRSVACDIRTVADPDDLKAVLSRFRESAVVPFEFNGGLYAVPEQQTMTVMFYRSDLLAKLGIPAPTVDNPWTWDDLIRYMPTLQQSNMSILLESGENANTTGLGSFAMLLYQNGGEFYEEGGISTLLDSETAIKAFTFWTNLYNNYGMPKIFNASNRFRTGESPIVITDFSMYNTLSVSAPEIKGLWEMAMVPGTVQEDGSVDYSSYAGTSGALIFSSSAHKEAAWDFLKWWTRADTQSHYATEMESLLGASARYPSANVEAFESLAWSLKDLKVLKAQAEHARAIPEVAGGYYLSRYITNAFRNVSSNTMEPREALLTYAQVIDDEIYQKRTEFGLKTR